MKQSRVTFYKVTILFLPFFLGVGLLYLFGEGIYHWQKGSLFGEDGKDLQTKYFHIFCHRDYRLQNIQDGKLLDVFVDAFYDQLGNAFKIQKPHTPTTVLLFRSDEEFQRYGHKQFHQDLTFNSGFYNPEKHEIAMVTTGSASLDQQGLFHEITHALFDIAAPHAEWSSWFSEGLATYFEQSFPRERSFSLGGHNKRFWRQVQEAPVLPLSLKQLVSADQNKFTSRENLFYYAEAHLLICFLMEDAKYRERFYNYFQEERKIGRRPPTAFEDIIGNFDEVEHDWYNFIQK